MDRLIRARAGLAAALALAAWQVPAAHGHVPAQDQSVPDARRAMVDTIRATAAEYPGLADDPRFVRVLDAIARIDRAAFVPAKRRGEAYRTMPIEIGYGQTISDPYVVAVMTALSGATRGSSVLEVGTGSGYQAAVLAELGARVHSIEIVAPLAASAARRLRQLGYRAVSVRAGDGFAGWPSAQPFDAIIVTAGSATIPQPLLDQLKVGGTLVMPIGPSTPLEQLVVVRKPAAGALTRCSLGPKMFVPLTGRGLTPDAPGLYDRSIPLCFKGQTARWAGQDG